MAIVKTNQLLSQLSGALGKQLIFKKYKNKTVITVFPYKPNKKKRDISVPKRNNETDFAKAVAYAQAILRDPKLKKTYSKKVKSNQMVYHYAIREYMKKYNWKRLAEGAAPPKIGK